ncbi:hypothetical protein ILYODFUR_033124 [Ilyodon furcidens]|uniref:Uncharacterized protein n=1 Tax=Ilyodon furcidens TaxID=33524 RepID=A0ABV0TRH7_9TELE
MTLTDSLICCDHCKETYPATSERQQCSHVMWVQNLQTHPTLRKKDVINGVTAGGRMCVFVLYLHQQTGQPMSLKRAVFLRAIGTTVSDGIGFLLSWIHSSSLLLTDSDLPARSALLLLDVSGSSCWTIHFLVLPNSPPIIEGTTLYKLCTCH